MFTGLGDSQRKKDLYPGTRGPEPRETGPRESGPREPGPREPGPRETEPTEPHFHSNQSESYERVVFIQHMGSKIFRKLHLNSDIHMSSHHSIYIRVLLRLEFQLAHPIPNVSLADAQK